jgi:hypothetical protein
MNRQLIRVLPWMLAALACVPGLCLAAVGDVHFRAPNKLVHLNSGSLSTSLDVFFEIDGLASVPATGWGMILNITPQAGATGTVQFNPPTIVNNEPNLMPAAQNPFLDFDRDFAGKSYGLVGASAMQLQAFSHYIVPALGPAPSLDANGNLTLHGGRGLVSLPLVMSANATGDFLVTFDPDPVVTGVVYATGLPAPNDVGIHPVATHVAGVLTIINPAADYNRNGLVDAADYVLWRNTEGQAGANLVADGNDNGMVEPSDYNLWRSQFGQSAPGGASSSLTAAAPEPASILMVIMLVAVGSTRMARDRGDTRI